jgi:hypothetical protein
MDTTSPIRWSWSLTYFQTAGKHLLAIVARLHMDSNLVLPCSSIACRNYPSGLVDRAPQDREQPLELVFRSLRCIDEGIPNSLPSSVDDIAGRVDVQHKPNDLRTGPITRACAKLLEQQVNSLLTEYNLFTNENFILPKSLRVCMIKFVAEASMTRGGEELHEDNRKMVPIISESTREERKAGAPPLKKKS